MNRRYVRSATAHLVAVILLCSIILSGICYSNATPASPEAQSAATTTRESTPAVLGNYWAKTYKNSSADDIAYSIDQTTDGGYILAGATFNQSVGYDIWVLKLNSIGSIIWQKTYGGTGWDQAYSVQQTSDGGFIVAGETKSFGVSGSYDFWVLKLNSTGGVTWQKTYGNASDDGASSIQQTSDGGYIVTGYTYSFGAGSRDFWVLKLDSTGGVTWQKTYGSGGTDSPYSIEQTADGGYVVAGVTNSFGAGPTDFWVIKLNSTGSVTWQSAYGGTGGESANSIRQTSDGGYIVVGSTYSFGASGNNVWVLKLDSAGSVTWQKTYGGTGEDYARSVRQTSDGGYIVAGMTYSFGAGSYDVWVLKLDSAGVVTWQKTYGGIYEDSVCSVQQTVDGGYVFVGGSHSFGAGDLDIWTVKLQVGGNIVWDVGTGASSKLTSVTPINSSVVANSTSAITKNSAATVRNTSVTPVDTSATVKVQSTPDTTPPAAISDLTASNPTNETIVLAWTAPGDDGTLGNATGYVVKYSTLGSITASNWGSATSYAQTWMPVPAGSTETHVISGLAANTTYWFAVEAFDEVPNYGGISNSPPTWTGSSPPVDLAPGGGGNVTTPPSYFEQNGFSLIANGAENVTLIWSASQPPNTTAPSEGTAAFVYLDVKGNLSTGSSQVILYIYYNRTEVQNRHLDENSLGLYVWNTTLANWQALQTTHLVLNTTHGVLFAVLPHFSYFAVFGAIVSEGALGDRATIVILVAFAAVVVALVSVVLLKHSRGGTGKLGLPQ